MLHLNRKTHYALAALVALARQNPGQVSAREIGKRFRLPLPALTNILHKLACAGLVVSTRGKKGGYRLARPPEEIPLSKLIEVIEGTLKLTECCCPPEAEDPDSDCDLIDVCPVHHPIRKVHDLVCELLEQVTLAHIVRDGVPMGVTLGTRAGGDKEPAHLTDTYWWET